MVGELPWPGASSTSGLATGSDARRQTGSTATGTAGCSERVDASLRVQGCRPHSLDEKLRARGVWRGHRWRAVADERRHMAPSLTVSLATDAAPAGR